MRTSLTEIEKIENLILEKGEYADRLVTQAKALIDSNMNEMIKCQKESYELIQLYGRNKLRREISEVEEMLFEKPKYKIFQQSIRLIFK